MKLVARSILLLAIGVFIGLSIRRSPATPAASAEPSPITDSTAEIVLERRIDEFRVDKMPLRDAVQKLADKAGIGIEADWAWLAKDEYKIDTLTTLNRRGERLVDLLRDLLNQPNPDRGAWIEPNGDRVRLWSETEPNPPMHIRLYDLRSLMTTGNQIAFLGNARYWSQSDDVDAIKDLIMTNLGGGHYTGLGWPGLQVEQVAHGRVMIIQRWEVHRQVRSLLAELKAPRTSTATPVNKAGVYTWNAAANKWLSADPEAFETLLEQPIRELRLTDVTFAEAIAAFAKSSGITVDVNYKSLFENPTELTNRQTIVCPPGPAGDALDQILARPWTDWTFAPMYVQHVGGLRITSIHEATPNAYLRFYDLRDWPPYVNEVQVQWHTQGVPGELTPQLVKDVVNNVLSETWTEAGGPWQGIQASGYEGVLLIRQTVQGHRQVRKLLAALRSVDDNRLNADAPK